MQVAHPVVHAEITTKNLTIRVANVAHLVVPTITGGLTGRRLQIRRARGAAIAAH